jgi:hypothetical protein
MRAIDVGADDRPDVRVVDRLHHRRATELRVVVTRPEADPADRNLSEVADQTGLRAGIDERAELAFVVRPRRRTA